MLQTLKNQILKLQRYQRHLEATRLYNPKVNCTRIWYGNTYGGFYVHPNVLSQTSVVYSFGIGEDVSFDLEMIRQHQCQVIGFDPTPKSIKWVDQQQLPSHFIFKTYGIGVISGEQKFHLPKNPDYVSGSALSHNNVSVDDVITVEVKCIKDIMAELGHNYIDVLKMDIEGSETDVLCASRKLNKVKQLFIEYHSFVDETQNLGELLSCLAKNNFRYYIHTQFCSKKPLIDDKIQLGMDLQLNIFAKQL